MHCHEFANRPSRIQISNALVAAIKAGHPHIAIIWGDNEIEAVRYPHGYVGNGFIKNVSGHDVVEKIVKTLKQETKLNIVTRYAPPPIPERSCDWYAYVDGSDEDAPVGYGATEAEAIEELKFILEEQK